MSVKIEVLQAGLSLLGATQSAILEYYKQIGDVAKEAEYLHSLQSTMRAYMKPGIPGDSELDQEIEAVQRQLTEAEKLRVSLLER